MTGVQTCALPIYDAWIDRVRERQLQSEAARAERDAAQGGLQRGARPPIATANRRRAPYAPCPSRLGALELDDSPKWPKLANLV